VQGVAEIRWQGRGGQGSATAARIAAGSAAAQGKHFQAFPAFRDDGPPRCGEPTIAYTRISDRPILVCSEVERPCILAVLDPGLLCSGDVTSDLTDDALVLVNSELTPAELRDRHGLKYDRLCCVAASTIARETGSEFPNTVMVGALARVTGLFSLESALDYVRNDFGRRFSADVAERNIRAITRGYEEVCGMTDGALPTRRRGESLAAVTA
jgi:pyruvate ferredoxin oxidoreductase gamma subunit